MTKSSLFPMIKEYFIVFLPTQRKLSANTIRSYKTALTQFLDFVKDKREINFKNLTFDMLDRKALAEYLDHLESEQGCSVSTRNQRLHCVRSFFSFAAEQDISLVSYWDDIKKLKTAVVAQRSVEHMSEKAVEIILRQPDQKTEKGLRDMFLMLLLYQTGARIQELLDIRLNDIHWGKTVTITLKGKGGKVRSVPIVDKAAEHLKLYVSRFHSEESSSLEQYLFFVNRDRMKKRMTEDNARKLIFHYGAMAKEISADIPDKVHPHIFRHSRAMHLYQRGLDLTLVSQWLGHSQFETTLIYAHADTELKRIAIEKAIPNDPTLAVHQNAERYQVSDEETLKRLCGLV